MSKRPTTSPLGIAFLLLSLPVLGMAQEPDDRVLAPSVVSEVLAAWNAPATRRVVGEFTVAEGEEVTGDLAVLAGSLTLAGRVTGRVVAINTDVRLTAGAEVMGDILIVGGRVVAGNGATVRGEIRTYRARLAYDLQEDRLVERTPGEEPSRWWRPRERWRRRSWSDLRLVSAKTYNRVEGLPLLLGPRFGRSFDWGRLSFEGSGILRSAEGFEWKRENLGHSLRAEIQVGHDRGIRVAGALVDVVAPVESWQLGDSEVGLATFFLHRDFRDYYNTHGGRLMASWFDGTTVDLSLSYADERWALRRTRDPWTVFRNDERWRDNPAMDEGNFHLLGATLRYDTRNDEVNPWSGWYLHAAYEYGTGVIDRYAPTTPSARQMSPNGATTYDRLFLDLRRYNRISPAGQLNLRLVAGGWLSGDELPMQRRFSVSGPGALEGYDFRRTEGDVDVWQCNTPPAVGAIGPMGMPAQCERFALAQVEYRGDLQFDPFGVFDEDRDWRRSGWGRGTQWVLFGDVGRGWLVGEPDGRLTYSSRSLPRVSSFRADVGIGLVLDDLGIYLSKAITASRAPVNVTLRLRPRF